MEKESCCRYLEVIGCSCPPFQEQSPVGNSIVLTLWELFKSGSPGNIAKPTTLYLREPTQYLLKPLPKTTKLPHTIKMAGYISVIEELRARCKEKGIATAVVVTKYMECKARATSKEYELYTKDYRDYLAERWL